MMVYRLYYYHYCGIMLSYEQPLYVLLLYLYNVARTFQYIDIFAESFIIVGHGVYVAISDP